jgi:hypothetical protein
MAAAVTAVLAATLQALLLHRQKRQAATAQHASTILLSARYHSAGPCFWQRRALDVLRRQLRLR